VELENFVLSPGHYLSKYNIKSKLSAGILFFYSYFLLRAIEIVFISVLLFYWNWNRLGTHNFGAQYEEDNMTNYWTAAFCKNTLV